MKAFECRMCGDCCYGEGGIYLDVDERKRIAGFLGITVDDFFSGYCEKRHGRVYIRTGEDNFCIFRNREKGCAIHEVKPKRCALWPYYPANIRDRDTWGLAMVACRGINRKCSFEEFVRQAPIVALREEPEREKSG